MAGVTDEHRIKETLLLLINADRAALSGERDLAEALLDEAEHVATAIRVKGPEPQVGPAPDEPEIETGKPAGYDPDAIANTTFSVPVSVPKEPTP